MDPSEKENSADLKGLGLKATGPRLKILDIFKRNATTEGDRHLSAEEVYRLLVAEGEEIGLATVYRVLSQFETAGILVRRNFENGSAIFELDDGVHHDHIVCIYCGKVEEFMDMEIEIRQNDIANNHGYKLVDHSMALFGICPDCQKKKGR